MTKTKREVPRLAAVKEAAEDEFVSGSRKTRRDDEPKIKVTSYVSEAKHFAAKMWCLKNKTNYSALVDELVRIHLEKEKKKG